MGRWLFLLLLLLASTLFLTLFLLSKVKKENTRLEIIRQAPSIEIDDYIGRQSNEELDYTKDRVSGTVLGIKLDDEGEQAVNIYFSWPPGSPLYNTTSLVKVGGRTETTSLALMKTPEVGDRIADEKVVERFVSFYETVQTEDLVTANCLNEYCSEIGGICEISRLK